MEKNKNNKSKKKRIIALLFAMMMMATAVGVCTACEPNGNNNPIGIPDDL